MQYLKFGLLYSNPTWTVSSWVPHISLTSHAPGGGAGSKCRTWISFDFVGASLFHKQMSSYNCNPEIQKLVSIKKKQYLLLVGSN